MNNSHELLTASNLCRFYDEGAQRIDVLKNLNFSLKQGERIAIVGPSGSGKSTLLHNLGGLDKPSEGSVQLKGIDWTQISEKEKCVLRNKELGFIYQFHHLLPEFSALENVAIPLLLAHQSPKAAEIEAMNMLAAVGLKDRAHHKPAQLSGGERQRVAIARALIRKPSCILADEPTGNLDQATALHVFDLILNLNKTFNMAIVIVTHDMGLAAKMDKILVLQKGQLHPYEA